MDGLDNNNSSKSYILWTQEMDGYLLEVLREQKIQGQKPDRNFSSTAYHAATNAVNVHFNLKLNKDHVLNRIKTLKRIMGYAIEVLRRGSGFAWNDITKTIDAEKPVWEALVQSFPNGKYVRGKPIPHLAILRELFEKDRATGAAAESAKEKTMRWEREGNPTRIVDIDNLVAQNEVHLENSNIHANEGGSQTTVELPIAHESSSNNGKRKVSDILNEKLEDISDSMKQIASSLQRSNVVAEQGRRRIYTGEEVFSELEKIDELSEDIRVDAYDFLMDNNVMTEKFFGCPVNLRKSWLFRKLNY